MMTKRQQSYLVESVEEGVKLVRDSGRIAVIAGRETLFFDIQRFGSCFMIANYIESYFNFLQGLITFTLVKN